MSGERSVARTVTIMRCPSLCALVVAAFIAVSGPVRATEVPATATASPSVELDQCDVVYPYSTAVRAKPGRLLLAFTNEGVRTASSVRFTIESDGTALDVVESGVFSPGVTIHKRRDAFPRVPTGGNRYTVRPVCRVSAVTYTDGSTDTQPSAALATTSPLVRIGSCRTHYIGTLTSKMNGGVYLTLTNTGARDIVVIRMAFAYPSSSGIVRFAGRFSPGVDVNLKAFPIDEAPVQWQFTREIEPTCRVSYVKYADGSVERFADPFAATPPGAAPAESAAPFAEPRAQHR